MKYKKFNVVFEPYSINGNENLKLFDIEKINIVEYPNLCNMLPLQKQRFSIL